MEDYKDRRGCINLKKYGSKVVLNTCNLNPGKEWYNSNHDFAKHNTTERL